MRIYLNWFPVCSSFGRFTSILLAATALLAGADVGPRAQRRGGTPILRHTASAQEGAAKLSAGLHLVDWNQITAEYERHRHGMFPDGKGGYHSRSHYHGWLARFDGKGFAVQPDSAPWSWGLELASWGPEGQEVAVSGAASMHANVNRMEYRRPGITEWFVNGKEGVEQGFTIPRRPAGKGENLVLRLRVRGGLVAADSQDGAGISFRTADGASALHYRKLVVSDANGRRVAARMTARDGMVDIAVDDRGAAYPLTVDPIVQQAYLKASNMGANDQFGNSVAIAGDTVVVGAPGEDSNATGVNGDQSNSSARGASGAAYVFVRSGATWSQQAYLKASNTGVGDIFGTSVAISGETVVVGAPREQSAATGVNGNQADNSLYRSGAAYVFVRSGSSWSQQAYLKASNTEWDDEFGHAVAIAGETVVVGAPGEDSNATGVNGDHNNDSAHQSGASYVFLRSGDTWSQQAYLKASTTGAHDYFGWSVAISVDTVVVGAYRERSNVTGVNGDQSNNSAMEAGAAYVFVRSGSSWSQQAYLKASNTRARDLFGWSVAISGDTVVVGAHREQSNATGVNGDQSNNSAMQAGAAYVFVRSGSSWSQQAYLKASNTGADDYFGWSVAIAGDTLLVGAPREDSNATGVNEEQSNNSASDSGAAYIFVRSGIRWSQQAYLKASNTGAGDYFGFPVAIAGNTVVVGAEYEDSDATEVNGNGSNDSAPEAGAAYVFSLASSLAPANATSASGGVTGATVLVNAESWLSWAATSNAPWLTITGGASGTGNGTVTYNVAANATGSERIGTITIGAETFTVTQSGPAPQATLTVLATATLILANGTTTLSTSGGSGSGVVTYAIVTGADTCSINGTTLTGSTIGNCSVTATKAGDSNYSQATSAAITITIASGTPTIGTATAGNASAFIGYTAAASANTTYTATCNPGWIFGAGATSPIRVNGLTNGVTYSCVVRAVNNGAAGAPSGPVTVTPTDLRVITRAPSIVYRGTMTLSTSGGVGTGAVTYSVATGGENCSISGSTLTGIRGGDCTVSASKAGDGTYGTQTSWPTTISILRANQATLTAVAAAATIGYRGTTTLSTTGGSGTGRIGYAVATGRANCSVNETTLTGLDIGTCTVTATKLGDGNYNQAVSAPIAVTVGKGTQATLRAVAVSPMIARNETTRLATTGGSGAGAVTYAVTEGGANCTLSGTTLTGNAVGTCTVTATKAGDRYFNAATAEVAITVQ
jgi:hypothetical protein